MEQRNKEENISRENINKQKRSKIKKSIYRREQILEHRKNFENTHVINNRKFWTKIKTLRGNERGKEIKPNKI